MDTAKPKAAGPAKNRMIVRSISRGISILQMVNRTESMSIMEIAQAAGMAYATTARVVTTLVHEGLLEREARRKRYRVTALVHSLSQGFSSRNRLVVIARPHIVALTEKVGWPITLTSRTGPSMIIRDSTHSLTSLTFNDYHPGYTFPLLESSSGRAYLAFCGDSERRTIFMGMHNDDKLIGRELLATYEEGSALSVIRQQGYATKARNPYTEHPGKTSSIAAPIFDDEGIVGAVAITFFASAVRVVDGVERYSADLKATARRIGDALSSNAEAPIGGA